MSETVLLSRTTTDMASDALLIGEWALCDLERLVVRCHCNLSFGLLELRLLFSTNKHVLAT